jgi:[protein-PII] uridylyltransferase
LYEITRALYELNASVRYAKIGTYLDQVVDVFYLTDLNGNKILAEQRLEEIQQGLAQAIEASRTT